jgi:hypothetical protein
VFDVVDGADRAAELSLTPHLIYPLTPELFPAEAINCSWL